MQSFLKNVLATALTAGDLIRREFHEPITPIIKSDGSVVTKTDRAAENVIRIGLSQLAPYVPFLGEESVEAGNIPDVAGGEFWVVDPLDGTKFFTQGRADGVAVLIALIRDFYPVLGLAHMPMTGDTYVGMVGDGAWYLPKEGEAKKLSPLPVTVPVTRRAAVENRFAARPSIGHYVTAAKAEVIKTDFCWPFLLVADGQADFNPTFSGTMEWDTGATHAILRAVGGDVVTADRQPLRYGKTASEFENPHLLASSSALLPELPTLP